MNLILGWNNNIGGVQGIQSIQGIKGIKDMGIGREIQPAFLFIVSCLITIFFIFFLVL